MGGLAWGAPESRLGVPVALVWWVIGRVNGPPVGVKGSGRRHRRWWSGTILVAWERREESPGVRRARLSSEEEQRDHQLSRRDPGSGGYQHRE